MKPIHSYLRSLLAVCLTLSLAEYSVAQQHWPRDFQNVGDTFFEFGAKVYDRPGDDFGIPLLINGLTNEILFDSGDLTDLNGGAGAEVRFGSLGPRGQKWEIRSFLTNWSSDFFFDNPNQTSPLSPDLDPDRVDLQYSSQLFSIEFNLRHPITHGFTFIMGPRFISLNEDIGFTTETNVPTPPFGSFDVLSTNTIETRNPMLGGQIGALIHYPVSRDIFVQGFIRTGGYLNFTELRTFADTNLMDEVTIHLRRNTGSFVGEVGGKVYMDLIPGLLSGFSGYEATWIDNVALAPAQAGTLSPDAIVTKVTPFFHALTFGLQFRR